MSQEGHITHGTAGRINVERTAQSVTLRLFHWSLSPVALLSFDEARKLVDMLQQALAPPKKAAAPVEDDDDDPW